MTRSQRFMVFLALLVGFGVWLVLTIDSAPEGTDATRPHAAAVHVIPRHTTHPEEPKLRPEFHLHAHFE
jgi:hypothetical protein